MPSIVLHSLCCAFSCRPLFAMPSAACAKCMSASRGEGRSKWSRSCCSKTSWPPAGASLLLDHWLHTTMPMQLSWWFAGARCFSFTVWSLHAYGRCSPEVCKHLQIAIYDVCIGCKAPCLHLAIYNSCAYRLQSIVCISANLHNHTQIICQQAFNKVQDACQALSKFFWADNQILAWQAIP